MLLVELVGSESRLLDGAQPAGVGRGRLRAVPRRPQVHQQEALTGLRAGVQDEAVVAPDLIMTADARR
jgi:hypothetical protein